jgi:hypothetical protein
MPFAEPETALALTIDVAVGEIIVREKISPPAACERPFTNFQSLTRRLNELQFGVPANHTDERRSNHFHGAICSQLCSFCNGIRFSMRVVRRVEYHIGGRVRRTTPELRRRLPGLLQAECASRRVRQLIAGILHHRRAGVIRWVDFKIFTTKDTKDHEGPSVFPSCTFVSFVVYAFCFSTDSSKYSRRNSARAIVSSSQASFTGIMKGTDPYGNWLQRWQNGGPQHGDHAV